MLSETDIAIVVLEWDENIEINLAFPNILFVGMIGNVRIILLREVID
jgi:hypothetical protein